MGGSGSNSVFTQSAVDLAKKIREAEAQANNQNYDIKINELISDLLIQVNNRDVDKIAAYLKKIKQYLEQEIDGTLVIRYGGSVAKHTYVDGLSDIDTLVLLDKSELKNKSPLEVKEYFAEQIKNIKGIKNIKIGKLAVTVIYKDNTEIQFLPALKDKTGYKIQSANSEEKWSKINPEYFVKVLRYVNIKTKGKMVPVIKMVKCILSKLPEKKRLSGYHIEALSIEVFKNYSGPLENKEMIKYFFQEASKHVLKPLKDRTGQSAHVDGYLGKKNSWIRQLMVDTLSNLNRRIANAEATGDVNYWKEILTLS